jgi:hypothetical protein
MDILEQILLQVKKPARYTGGGMERGAQGMGQGGLKNRFCLSRCL